MILLVFFVASILFAMAVPGLMKRAHMRQQNRLMERSTAATNDKIRKRLAKFIQTKLQADTRAGSGPGSNKGGTTQQPKRATKLAGVVNPPRDTDDANLPHVPTYIKFEKQHVRLVQGAQSAFWVEINAKNGYLQENKDALEIGRRGHDQDKVEVTPHGRKEPLVHRLRAGHRSGRLPPSR